LGGQTIDTIGIAENGYLFISDLSPFAVSSPWPISTQHRSRVTGIISALGIDLHPVDTDSQKTTVKSALVGRSPYRTLIIEWSHTSTFSAHNDLIPDDISFQIKLYETTGRIEFTYGKFKISPSTTEAAEVGLKGSSYNDFVNRKATTNDWKSSIPGRSQTARISLNATSKPELGTLYAWEPRPDLDIDKADGVGSVSLYPNPATKHLLIAGIDRLVDATYSVVAVNGLQMSHGPLIDNVIDISALAPGVYLFRIETRGKAHILRFVKE